MRAFLFFAIIILVIIMKLEEKLVECLINKGYTISFAESCTGGLCAARIINVSDASKVINESFITYSNESKIKYLGVSPDIISKYGVVSEHVVVQMALGVANTTNSNIGVGISGIAGPKGGTEIKPVGMVCFGFSINGKVTTKTLYFGNIGRNKVREKSVDYVFEELVNLLGDGNE